MLKGRLEIFCNYWIIWVKKFEVKGLPQGAMMLFLVTENPILTVHMCSDDVIMEFCIANEGDSEQGASRQQI